MRAPIFVIGATVVRPPLTMIFSLIKFHEIFFLFFSRIFRYHEKKTSKSEEKIIFFLKIELMTRRLF